MRSHWDGLSGDQMREYAEAHRAQQEGRPTPRLDMAFAVCVALILIGVIALIATLISS